MNGYADRRAYEAWVEALPEGQYKEGAYYWASGCLAAKSRLDPTDRRRSSEPDYKAGWNSASREIERPKPWNR